jgi:hypothetical protein
VAAAGGPTTVIGTDGVATPGPIAVDGTTVVFADFDGGFAEAITLVDGTLAECELLSPSDILPTYVDCTRIAQGQGDLLTDDIVVTGGEAYFVDGPRLRAASTSKYEVVEITNSMAFGVSHIAAFTLDGANAYFAAGGSVSFDSAVAPALPGFVARTPLVQESKAVPLARVVDPRDAATPATITSIAVGADAVFYATGDCAIWTIPK